MRIELLELTIREVVEGYADNADSGVTAYNGRLNVRPAYQREFIYGDKQRDEVINTIRKGFPLNVMYWAKSDGGYELMDGQQRTISFCQYVNSVFSISENGNFRYFHNLTDIEKNQILDYKLMIYVCDGSDVEKLEWFRIINIAGVELTQQELRNAVYTGTWLHDAKKWFSRSGCPCSGLYKDYMKGSSIRQEYLETALRWIADRDHVELEKYMAIHQHDANASELWQYVQMVMNWVKVIFPNYRKEMKGLEWGLLYNKYGNTIYNANNLEQRVKALMMDDEVTAKSGIYPYLLGQEQERKYLSLRAFSESMKVSAYERQNGICPICHNHFSIKEMEGDHITPWSEGGKTEPSNCQMLCKSCNRHKSNH